MKKQGTQGQFKAHQRAAAKTAKQGATSKDATLAGLIGEFEYLTGSKLS